MLWHPGSDTKRKGEGMVEYLLGNYLVKQGKLTGAQLEEIITKQDETRVKMGLLAVSEGMMTVEQAENVNRLQASMDKRFGDIAVEKGYLTEEQISNLLKKQGNAYLAFAQALVNAELLTLQELEEMLDGFQNENGFSKSDMEDIRSDEPERIVPLFLPPEALDCRDIAGVMLRTLIRCVDRHVYIGKVVIREELPIGKAAFQKMVGFTAPVNGNRELETGFAEKDGGLLAIAAAYCREDSLEEEDLLDAAGELLNCVNGLYVSGLSRSGVDSELLPPIELTTASVLRQPGICSIPVRIKDKEAEFIIVGRK